MEGAAEHNQVKKVVYSSEDDQQQLATTRERESEQSAEEEEESDEEGGGDGTDDAQTSSLRRFDSQLKQRVTNAFAKEELLAALASISQQIERERASSDNTLFKPEASKAKIARGLSSPSKPEDDPDIWLELGLPLNPSFYSAKTPRDSFNGKHVKATVPKNAPSTSEKIANDPTLQLKYGALSQPHFILTSGRKKKKFPLRPGKNRIGRSSQNDIVVHDSSVSRQHCSVEVRPQENGICILRDECSTKGTRVNGAPVQKYYLRRGDKVRIGDTVLTFKASFSEAVDLSNPLLSGYLLKKSPAFHKKWQKRWCIIKADVLFYLTSPNDTIPSGIIDLNEVTIVDEGPPDSPKFKLITVNRDYCFKTCGSNNSYEQEKQRWIVPITKFIERKKQKMKKMIKTQQQHQSSSSSKSPTSSSNKVKTKASSSRAPTTSSSSSMLTPKSSERNVATTVYIDGAEETYDEEDCFYDHYFDEKQRSGEQHSTSAPTNGE
ncbi:Sigma-54 dependent transcription regulator [Balamuthia mandrillaris]